MDAVQETLTDKEVIDLIMTSDDNTNYSPEDVAWTAEHQAAITARYREEMKEWTRKAKLKNRKTQGGLRDYWAELIARDGLPPKGLRLIPGSALSQQLKVNRTLVLKRADGRRKARMEMQMLLSKPPKPVEPWRKPIKSAEDMAAWIKVSSEKMRRDNEETARRKEERLKLSGYVDTPEKRAEIKARAEVLARVSDKHLRNHGYANRSSFMNSAGESADLEDQGLCPIMDDNISEHCGGDD